MKNINSNKSNKPKYKCVVCKLPFNDGWEHTLIQGNDTPFLLAIDSLHGEYMAKVEKSNYELPCFCGGHITIRGTGPDSWETTCDNCEYLWDED